MLYSVLEMLQVEDLEVVGKYELEQHTDLELGVKKWMVNRQT